MWFLFQIAITLIIGSNGAYHWAGENSGFAVPLLAAFAASWLSAQRPVSMDASQARIGRERGAKKKAAQGGLR
jgi:hypothetical protein